MSRKIVRKRRKLRPAKAAARRPPAEARGGAKAAAGSGRNARRRAAPRRSDAIDALIAAGAKSLALPIEPAWRSGVRFNLQLILEHAARVEDFPLPNETEPAPVFHA